MKLLLLFLLCFFGVLKGAPLVDLSRAGIPLEGGNEKNVVLSDEKGKALHNSKIWRKGKMLHRRNSRGHAAYKLSKVVNTPDGVKLVTSKEFGKIRFPDGVRSNFSTRFHHQLELKPEYVGKKLIVSFRIRGRFYPGESVNYLFGGIIFQNRGTKGAVSHLSRRGMPRKTEVITYAAPVPAGRKYATFHMALYGCGEMEVLQATVKLSEKNDAMSPDVIVTTSGYADREFHLPYKKSFPMKFAFRREFTYKPRSAKLYVELPKGFSCTGNAQGIYRLKDEKGALVFNIRSTYLRTHTRNTFTMHNNSVLIRADVPPSERFYTMRYWIVTDGKSSVPRTLKLKVLPFEKHTAPRILKSGVFYSGSNTVNFDARSSEDFADMYKNCGFNLIYANTSQILARTLGNAGITRIGSGINMRNGYRAYARVPAEHGFTDISGKPIAGAFCPAAVYNRMESYRSSIFEVARKRLGPGGFYDHAAGNWEPYMYDYKGCFCRRCGEEFARYAKLDWKKDVEKIWPKKILALHRQKWVDFRSWQHGKLLKVLNEDAGKAGAEDRDKKSFFFPLITCTAFIGTYGDHYSSQYHFRDYIKSLEGICIWGPYVRKATLHSPYRYTPGEHLPYLFVCARAADTVRRFSKTKILGLPNGSHTDWVTTPEAIAFETLGSFVYGYHMSVPFWFAYDYRAYREMGRMNTLTARVEPFLVRGKASYRVKGTPVTPFLEHRHWKAFIGDSIFTKCKPAYMKNSALQLRRFDLDGKICIAAANAWEKGGVFFKLQLPEFKGRTLYAVTDVASGKTLKAAGDELRKGVELFLKELSWGFFVIEPLKKGKKYLFTSAAAIAGQKKKLLPVLKKAWEEENKLLRESGPAQVVSFDFDAMPEIRSGSLLCRRAANSTTGAVEVISPRCRIEIDPAVNGRIRSWKVGKSEIVSPNPEFGFGVVGCWMPHRRPLRGKYTVTNVEGRDGKIYVDLKLAPSRKNNFETRIRYIFDDTGFRQETEVFNRGKMASDMMLRFHTFSSMISSGTIMAGKKRLPVLPKVVLFRNGAKNDNTEHPLKPEESFNIPVEHCIISPKNTPFDLEFKAKGLYGVIMWNNPGYTLASFEATYFPVMRVQPGKSVKAAQSWHILKK